MFCFLLVVLYYLISIYRVSLTYQYTNKAFSVELRTIFLSLQEGHLWELLRQVNL